MHYCRLIRTGETGAAEPTRVASWAGQTCSVEGCARPVSKRALCSMHYRRLMDKGAVGQAAPLKAEDGAGNINKDGYRRITVDGECVMEHKHVMERRLGRRLRRDERVHHMNTQRDDNRDENLELWLVGHPAGARVSDLVAYLRETGYTVYELA